MPTIHLRCGNGGILSLVFVCSRHVSETILYHFRDTQRRIIWPTLEILVRGYSRSLNVAKSKEIVLSLHKTLVSAATCPTRVESLTVLGITFNSKLRFEPHISYITHSAARCLYDLKTLRAHGLAGKPLWDVTQATLIARILYAAQTWWGFQIS